MKREAMTVANSNYYSYSSVQFDGVCMILLCLYAFSCCVNQSPNGHVIHTSSTMVD